MEKRGEHKVLDMKDLKVMEREGQRNQNIQQHTNTKLCALNDLEMVEREGGRANSGGRKQLTEEEVGCMCIEVICNCVA